jgi:hypothetical protein
MAVKTSGISAKGGRPRAAERKAREAERHKETEAELRRAASLQQEEEREREIKERWDALGTKTKNGGGLRPSGGRSAMRNRRPRRRRAEPLIARPIGRRRAGGHRPENGHRWVTPPVNRGSRATIVAWEACCSTRSGSGVTSFSTRRESGLILPLGGERSYRARSAP